MVPEGRLVYKGKVVDVRREVKGGWTIGTTTLEPFRDDDDDDKRNDGNGDIDTRQLVLSYQVSLSFPSHTHTSREAC